MYSAIATKSFKPYFPGVTFQSQLLSLHHLNYSRFNPYFPGVTFQSWQNSPDLFVFLMFQSLFSWSYLSKLPIKRSNFQIKDVSILIFLELPFKDYVESVHHFDEIVFQSLFSWSYLSKNIPTTCAQRLPNVSILIFLELPFKVRKSPVKRSVVRSFNPYFPGVTFQSRTSLFCLDWLRYTGDIKNTKFVFNVPI